MVRGATTIAPDEATGAKTVAERPRLLRPAAAEAALTPDTVAIVAVLAGTAPTPTTTAAV